MANMTNDHDTTDRVAAKAHEAVNKAATTAGKAEEYTREHVASAEESVRKAAGKGRDKAEDVVGRVNSYVHENPLLSIGIAFLAGSLYTSMKRRR